MEAAGISKGSLWVGWILTVLVSLMMAMGAVMAFLKTPQTVQGLAQFGYSARALPIFGALELLCALLFLIPRTSVLGAILMTAYFGGAVATHIRIGDGMFLIPVIIGIVVWLGIYLREPRLSALVPLRR
jgi:sorbitol-specific phosphotransferase system component IIC